MIAKDSTGRWSPISNAVSSPPEYKHGGWSTLRIRIKHPFYWKPEIEKNGIRLALDTIRLLKIGEVVDALEPDALTYVAQGRAELV